MDILKDLVINYPLICAVAGWLVAQLVKIFTGMFKERKFNIITLLCGTGGMPSSHTAAVTALCVACAIKEGFGSVAFAISVILCVIVMRDATGVRWETGEQAKVLNHMMHELFKPVDAEARNKDFKEFKELVGHTPLQVFAGFIVGIIVPFVLMLIPTFRFLG